jgi:DNA-binding transcriptional regulator YiaG
VDHPTIASELIRALRGRRSQPAFSRWLGYRSNVVYRWESGRAWPTAAGFFRAARRAGVDLAAGLARFYRTPPPALGAADLTKPEGVARLLGELRGSTTIGELARRAGRSRFAVSRWLKGEAEPRLPELLLLVDVATLRLLDFLAMFVDPACLASVASAWATLQAARESAYSAPWSHAVLRVLELHDYAALERPEPGWIARRLGISVEEEKRCLELLKRTRQIRRVRRKWVVDKARTVDTRADPERSRQVKLWWTRTALERAESGGADTLSYNLFSVSAADFERIRELYRSFYAQMRAIVADSAPNERVILWSTLIVPLEPPGAAGGASS